VQHLLNNIKEPIVCSACLDEFAKGQTDAKTIGSYLRMDIGFTQRGIQVWCQRHDANIVEIDFAGFQPEADFRALIPKENKQ